MNKLLFFTILLFSWELVFCQQTGYEQVIIEQDTFSIELTNEELSQIPIERYIQLEFGSQYKNKKKKLKEKIGGELKLKGSDTIFWVSIYDYFDDYFIGFVGTSKKISKKEYMMTPLGYRRIEFEQIDWLKTDGRRNFWPQFILGFTTLIAGAELTIFPIIDSFKGNEKFPLWLIPVGIATTYIGYRITDGVMTKTYYLDNWWIEVKEKGSKIR